MDAEAAVDAGTGQADEDAELGRGPLRGGRAAVAADIVLGFGLDGDELDARAKERKGGAVSKLSEQREHDRRRGTRGQMGNGRKYAPTLDLVSGSTSHIAFEAILGDQLLGVIYRTKPSGSRKIIRDVQISWCLHPTWWMLEVFERIGLS